jgi:glycosyltransferase involved in cell wall biosynthesis
MKILFLAEPNSSHVTKWANSLNDRGVDIAIFGLSNSFNKDLFNRTIKIENITVSKFIKQTRDGNLLKSSYLLSLSKIKKIISEFKPDILHAHSASSYGFLGALSGFHPYFVSIWGSDVYLFPRKSFIHKYIFKFTLKKGDSIFTTSLDMKNAAKYFSNKDINVIPFGVDTEVFKPMKIESVFSHKALVIGSVKALDYNYGIEYLIAAFASVSKKYPALPLKLLLVGDGSKRKELEELSQDLSVNDKIKFTGKVEYKEIVRYHNMIDIAVVPSVSEGFGVSVLESSACGKPVITSDAGGLPEVVKDQTTGFIFPSRNIIELEKYLERLILDRDLRTKMGNAGREMVKQKFEWKKCVDRMINFYSQQLIDK